MKKRYLHVGCGDNILPPPFENLDIRPLEGVEHVSDVFPLSFEDDTFDMIYASHILEHFNRNEVPNILQEWVSKIKPGGLLRLSVPSLEQLIKIYGKTKDISSVIGPFMGGQTYAENFHYMLFDHASLSKMMEDAGLIAVHTWDYRRTEHTKHWDFSQAVTNGIPISLNLEGRKPLQDSDDEFLISEISNRIQELFELNAKDKMKTVEDVHSILRGLPWQTK